MTRPAVTVLMPVLDADPAYLRAAVESVLAQTMTDWELLVVEDPSPRPAADVLAAYADPRIRHLANPTRTGFAAQLNRGLHEARGEWVARLDADDVCTPHRLVRQLHAVAAGGVDVLGSQLELIDPHGRRLGYRGYPLDHAGIVAALRRYNPVAHPAVLVRRSTVLAVGGYRATPFAMVEDYDLWCRLAKAGARFATHPEPLVKYRVHPQASKRRQLRETLRGSLHVKREHWAGAFRPGDRVRLTAERCLLALPAAWVFRLFLAVQRRRSLPRPAGGLRS